MALLMRRNHPRRDVRALRLTAAFTLVELLTVIAIIGVLVALLLPAVQAAREAARRTTCFNRLRQTAIATLNYESYERALPVGCVGCRFEPAPPGGDFQPQRFMAWNVELLPHLEQQAVYDLVDFEQPSYAPPNRAAASVVIETFLCPSTQEDIRLATSGLWNGCAFTDYGGVYGVEGDGNDPTEPNAKQHLADEHLGVMLFDEPTPLQAITDGTSRTVAIAELLERRGAESHWINGHNLVAQEKSTPINATSELGGDIGSPHPGGAVVAFCDGHLQFLSDSIEQPELNALLTRAGGE